MVKYKVRPVPAHLKRKSYTINTYRQAKTSLLKCYKRRCGYSLLSVNHAGGARAMEVDHFNPALKKKRRQPYAGFVLASRHCNGSKSDTWPKKAEVSEGFYLLNPRDEIVYVRHIREHKPSGKLIPITRAGLYHIDVLDLNADHLCDLRKKRTEMLSQAKKNYIVEVENKKALKETLRLLEEASDMIVELPEYEGELVDWLPPDP